MRRSRRVKRVVILGCGPAGMFAAHAAVELGLDIQIFSRLRVSDMFGAQYLHSPINGLTSTPSETIHYTLKGTPEEYAAKVYGDDRPESVSVESLVGDHLGWDIRDTYYIAWARYMGAIVDTRMIDATSFMPSHAKAHAGLYNALQDTRGTQVISTIPAHMLCAQPQRHTFRARSIWAAGDAPERGHYPLEGFQIAENTVACNGEKAPSWYRLSNVFGYKTCEWPMRDGFKPPIPGIAQVEKVVSTDCDCWGGQIWRMGRMGTWDKSKLAHTAYEETRDALRRVM